MGQQHQHVPDIKKPTEGKGMPSILTYTQQGLTDLAQGSISRCLLWLGGHHVMVHLSPIYTPGDL